MKLDFTKWVVIGLSGLIGVSHIGMIGLLGTRKEPIAQSNQTTQSNNNPFCKI
jgi:hypothetical protein